MMTVSDGISAAHAEQYYEHEHVTDYYVDGPVAGAGFGRGALALGLAGEVAPEAFRRVLAREHPTLDARLVTGSSAADDKRVAAWDVTFGAPKSVSIAALVFGDAHVVEALAQCGWVLDGHSEVLLRPLFGAASVWDDWMTWRSGQD